jgi:hypothetical protein
VTKDSITIQWPDLPDKKPKRFAVSQTLAAGKMPKERRLPPGPVRPNPMMPEFMYRLTDVKVGDLVTILYARVNGVDICDHICIKRRPGGLVPPLPKEAEELRDVSRHEREAYKAKFPNGPVPEWLAKRPVPYHELINDYWARQAPMPREKGRIGPLISP